MYLSEGKRPIHDAAECSPAHPGAGITCKPAYMPAYSSIIGNVDIEKHRRQRLLQEADSAFCRQLDQLCGEYYRLCRAIRMWGPISEPEIGQVLEAARGLLPDFLKVMSQVEFKTCLTEIKSTPSHPAHKPLADLKRFSERKLKLSGHPRDFLEAIQGDIQAVYKAVHGSPSPLQREAKKQKKRSPRSISAKKEKISHQEFSHSPDYRSVNLRGKRFTFTAFQAEAVKELHNAFKNGTPDLSQATILSKIAAQSARLKDIFRGSNAWGSVVVRSSKRGAYRLGIEIS